MHSENFHLVNFHAPVGGVNSVYANQDMFLGSVYPFVFSKDSALIGGDFNCVDNPAFNRTNLLNSYKSLLICIMP